MVDTFDFSRRAMLGSAFGIGAVGALEGSAAAGTPPIPSSSNCTYRLTATGINGDAGDGAMEVLTFGFGSTTSASPLQSGSGGGASKAVPMDFIFVKPMDSASPGIHKNLVLGKIMPSIVLTGRQGEDNYDFLRLELSTTMFTSYAVAPNENTGYPLDVVHAKFVRIKQTFTPPNPDDPGPGTPVSFTFDYRSNRV